MRLTLTAFVMTAAVSGVHAEDRFIGARSAVRLHFAAPGAPALDAQYVAAVDVEHYQTGRHASRYHPIDDRQCRWSAVAFIQRDLCRSDGASPATCDDSKRRRFPVNASPAPVNEAAFASQNCAISREAFAPQLQALRVSASAAMSQAIAADRAWLQRDLGPGVEITAYAPLASPSPAQNALSLRHVDGDAGPRGFAEASR